MVACKTWKTVGDCSILLNESFEDSRGQKRTFVRKDQAREAIYFFLSLDHLSVIIATRILGTEQSSDQFASS